MASSRCRDSKEKAEAFAQLVKDLRKKVCNKQKQEGKNGQKSSRK